MSFVAASRIGPHRFTRQTAMVIAGVIGLASSLALAQIDASHLIPRAPLAKSDHMVVPAQASRLIVKFTDQLQMRVDNNTLVSLSQVVPEDIQQTVDQFALTFEPLVQLPDDRIAVIEDRVTQRTATLPPDLRGMMVVHTDTAPPVEVAQRLNKSAAVEFVYFQELTPPPPCDDIAPATPQYFPARQSYHGPNPGLNMTAAWQMGDARGAGIVVADCEYGFVEGHEDLCDVLLEPGQTIHPTVRSLGWDEHGTAVLGEIMSIDNGYGCTGLAPESEGLLFPEWTVEEGFRRVTAIANAIASVRAGDIVVLEMQTTGPGNGYGPAELDPAVWTLVKAGTDGGVIIVAAAGNGNQDLDSPPYAEYRNRGDSGAIIVGAGSPDSAHNKLSFSTYGQRVNVQGWGLSVFTLGYGDFAEHGGDKNQRYTSGFSGTSSATPFIAGSCSALQSLAVEQLGRRLSPLEMRDLLESTGLPQGSGGNIGPFPNVQAAALEILSQSSSMQLFVGPLIAGENAAFTVSDGLPDQRTYLIYSLTGRGSTFVGQLNVTLDLAAPILARSGRTDGNGLIDWSVPIPQNAAGRTIWTQAAQLESKSNVVESVIE